MALLADTDFISRHRIDGAGSPSPDLTAGGRDLVSSFGATPPRATSYSRRRGCEFKSASFEATSPACFRTAGSDLLKDELYVSSKIQSFTWYGWFRPSRSGSSPLLTAIGGIHSASNMGGTSRIAGAPVMACTTRASANGVLYVFVGDVMVDTLQATQTGGPASTAPVEDSGWNAVAVCVTASASNNNEIESIVIRHRAPNGTRRVYTAAARKATGCYVYSLTVQPSDGDTVTIDGQTYTWKTALGGTAATTTVAGTGVNLAAGETISIGGITYTAVTSLTPVYATAILELNDAGWFENIGGGSGAEVDKGEVKLRVGGYEFYILFNTFDVKTMEAGYIDGYNKAASMAAALEDIFELGAPLPIEARFKKPVTPVRLSPDYTGENNIAWTQDGDNRKWEISGVATVGAVVEVTFSALSYGASVIPIQVVDGWKSGVTGSATGAPTTWRARVKSGSVDNPAGPYVTYNPSAGTTQGIFKGGVSAPANYSFLIGANYAATKANLIKAVNKTGTEGVDYYGVTAANPLFTASDPGGNDILLTSVKLGTAGNGDPVSDTSAQLTTANAAGGADGLDSKWVKIGADVATSWANLLAALNDAGTRGVNYGSATSSAHATVEAVSNTEATVASTARGRFLMRARTAGSAGNSIALAKSSAAIISIRDEWCDETKTTLSWGCSAPNFTIGAGYRPDQTDLRIHAGGLAVSPEGSAGIFHGTISETGLITRAISDLEFAELTTTPPPVSTRDRGWGRYAARTRVSSKTDRMTNWRMLTPLAPGATGARVPVRLNGRRAAARVWGVEAGRPFSVSRLALTYDKVGGALGARPGVVDFPGFMGGVNRHGAKEDVPPGGMYDSLNVSRSRVKATRRRGFRIVTGDGATSGQPSAVYDCTTSTGEVQHLAFIGGTLYLLDNDALTELDTGWDPNELPTVATVGVKTFICQSGRQRVYVAGSVLELGIDAPTTAPQVISSEAAASGGVVLNEPGWEYVVTYYDGAHLTDSGPSPSLVVVKPSGTLPQNLTLGIPVSADSDVTKRKIWKRKVGTGIYFLVAVVDDNTTTSYEETTDEPTEITLDAFGDLAVTAEWPGVTQVAAHEGRLVGWGNPDDERIVYYSELGDGERWFVLNSITAQASVRASLSHEGRHYIFTDRTTEVVEGDFYRGTSGLLGIAHKVLDTSRGAFGPFAACVGGGRVFWADPVGVHAMRQGDDQQNVGDTISWEVNPLIRAAIDTSGSSVVLGFNPVSQELWACLTQTDADSVTKNRVVLALDLERRRWSPLDHQLSWITRLNDGEYGEQFIGCDYFGNVLELDVYDGDGVTGAESWFPDGGKAIASISGNTLTFSGTSFPTSGLRGVSIVLEDLSSTNTPFYRVTIISSTATTLTVDRVPSAIAAADLAHVGGIIGKIETGEADAGEGEIKVWREIVLGLSDMTQADL